ncbi:MAG: gliding motility-associated C-terminal domain-containing protein, partial [Cyclobacteriaceae bacterium]|nr:gliding motility-associated C-terminal domain-containing protein [Cyclobacteriaceae bacterium]
NPTVDGINSSVSDIVVSGSIVYVSGFFTSAGGASRRSLAALDVSTGSATTWNPNPNSGVVRTMELAGSTMYIGGSFTSVGGTLREYLAEVSTSTGALTSWDPNFDDFIVYKVILSGTTLYVAGTFETVNGLPKANLVAVSTITGALTSWDPTPGEWVTDMALFGNTLFVEAGDNSNFRFNWVPANNFAVIDNVSGEIFLNDLNTSSGTISAAITSGNTMYISGDFTDVNGQPRSGLAAIDIPSGTLLPWEPFTDGHVTSLSLNGSTVFLGGNFSSVNGSTRTALAAVDAVSGDLLSLNHEFDGGEIYSLFATGTILYVGGNFSSVDGTGRNNIAAFTISTGNILSWNPTNPSLQNIIKIEANTDWIVTRNLNNTVIALDASSANTYVEFTEELNDFGLTGNILILGTSIEDSFGNNGLTAFNLEEGDYTSWNPDVGSDPDGYPAISSIGTINDLIFVGGNFRAMGFEFRENFGAYTLTAAPNQAPVILSTTTGVSIEGIVTISLLGLISDPDDNLDLATLSVINNTSAQGAYATINALSELVLDYSGVLFSGTDHVTIEVCDDLNDCTQQEITIEVVGDVIVYNAISPNPDDNLNSVFLIQYIDLFPDTQQNRVTIYNRWGDAVFEITNYDNQTRVFRGLNKNGNELPSGTYFYKLEFTSSGLKMKTGYLSLKR